MQTNFLGKKKHPNKNLLKNRKENKYDGIKGKIPWSKKKIKRKILSDKKSFHLKNYFAIKISIKKN